MTSTASQPSKILVGVDFSDRSDVAVAHAIEAGRHLGAEVVLLHACTVPEIATSTAERPGSTISRYRALLEANLAGDRKRLEDLRVRLSGQGVEVSHVVVDEFPDVAIPRAADELGAGLIVLGTHGRTGLEWLLLGSVTRRVVRLAGAGVLVARGEAPRGGYRRICVATDFSPGSERALEAALAHAGRDARVDLVHLWDLTALISPGELPVGFGALRDDLEADLTKTGEALAARYRRAGVSVGFQAIPAPTIPGLIDHLEKGDYDLVALGSHGRRGIRRFVLGSVAEAVAARAPCSALVVHGAQST